MSAIADESGDAKAHFHKGADLYKQARYQDAITEFEAAYRARPSGVLRFNVAQCYEKLGDIPNAIRGYRDYVREVPQADDRGTVEAAIGNMEGRLTQRGRQALLVYTTPSAAAVVVDGNAMGTSPISVELIPGNHQLQVALLGYRPLTQTVSLGKEHLTEVNLTLHEGSAPEVMAPPPLATTPDLAPSNPLPTAAGNLQSDKKAKLEPLPEPSHPRLWTWVAAGAAGVALTGAIIEGVSANANANKLQSTKPQDIQNRTSNYNAAKSQSLTANILYGVAGAAGAGAVALFFIEGSF